MDKKELIARTRQFAVRVFKLSSNFRRSQAAKVVTYQLLRSASSVAANYRAAVNAKSGADFLNKLKIVLEEADESNFWLEFAIDVEIIEADNDTLIKLVQESKEFIAILTSSIKTLNDRSRG